MAHFLEHLVFKGGEIYDDYRKVNETAERMGGVAERLHEPRPRRVPHHRARRVGDARDGPADRLRRAPEARPAGARPGARRRHPGDPALQGPAGRRRRRADRARRVRRPSARPHRPRARGAPARHVHPRGDRRVPRPPLVGPHGGAFIVGNLDHVPADGAADELFGRFPDLPADAGADAPGTVRPAGARRGARLQPVAPADDLPPGRRSGRPGPARGVRHLLDAARRLDGLAAVRRDPRAARARLLRLGHGPLRLRSRRCCRWVRAWSRRRPSRPTPGCARSSPSSRRTARPRRRSSARAPTPPVAAC